MELPTGNERFHRMSVDTFETEKVLLNASRQRDRRKFDDVLIVDVDAHHYESESMNEIIDYMEDPVLKQLAKSSNQVGQRGIVAMDVSDCERGHSAMKLILRSRKAVAQASRLPL